MLNKYVLEKAANHELEHSYGSLGSFEAATARVLGSPDDRYHTPATIRNVFVGCAGGKDEIREYNRKSDLNLSGIGTVLIQNVGRFCERYASDLFIDWHTLTRRVEDARPGDNSIMAVAIRADGVDNNTFLMSRLTGTGRDDGAYLTPEYVYRKIFGIQIVCENEDWVTVILRDITHGSWIYDAADNERRI